MDLLCRYLRELPPYEDQPFAEHDAAGNKQDPENIAYRYIRQGSFPVADPEQLKGFPGKG